MPEYCPCCEWQGKDDNGDDAKEDTDTCVSQITDLTQPATDMYMRRMHYIHYNKETQVNL